MAHLEVEPKPSRPWWVWMLIVLLIILLAGLLLNKCNDNEDKVTTVDTVVNDSTQTTMAGTDPDWSTVDLNSATLTDADITDADIQTRGNESYTIYLLSEDILFPSAGKELSENGVKKLQLIADVIKKRFDGATIGVYGSTDSRGPADENYELGKERATSVKEWLAQHGNVAGNRISVQTLGETEPIGDNDTKAGRQQNRNVSIVVFPKK